MPDAGERESLIRRYEEGPDRLKSAFAKVPEEARQWRPAPGKWSAHEIVCHCADSETNASLRIRTLTAEKEPVIVGYDQDEWARVLDYHALPLEPALHTIEAVRESTAVLLRRLPEAAWGREGKHSDSGRYTAHDWLRIYSDHLEKHSRQIERNLAAWQES